MTRNWLLFALLTVGLPVTATEMYTWTDANDVKHFSDSPPPNATKVQKIKVTGGITTRTTEDLPKTDTNTTAGPTMAAAAGYTPEDIKRNCEIARKNLASFQTQKPQADENGEATDPKSRQDQIDRANQQIKLFCGE
ncbi:MAG: DUF4124 domain-containing protein [Rhodanobacter sp.]|jgi:hypothetical protein|nr:DUF4124 domain-containing protein [Rhodanobacter sp.]